MKYTIIITVYNKEKYVERAIKSACNQTFKNYEIMVVNDGSTDNSEKIIKKYEKKHKIKYFKKENSGIADTRNYAISKVETEYFLFLDADDYLTPNLLETVDKYDDYEILSFNAVNINENNEFIMNIKKPEYSGNGKNFFIEMAKNKTMFTVPWGYIYKTEYIKKNNFEYPKGKILEDFYLTPFIIVDSKKIISIDYIGYYYVNNEESIMNSNVDLITKTYLEHCDNMLKKIEKYDDELERKLKSFIVGILLYHGSTIKGKKRKEYIKILKNKKIIQLVDKPFFRKYATRLLFKINLYYPIRKLIKKS